MSTIIPPNAIPGQNATALPGERTNAKPTPRSPTPTKTSSQPPGARREV